ncbi:MAG: hypothetical protein LUI39_11925 [Lachnospiraceae bacterium]|nr:hypothetical protein [Lachnospiraceae bacterium]
MTVIDDVIVKGKFLEGVASKLHHEDIGADYFVAACEAEYTEQFYNGIEINKSYHYKQNDI